MSNRRGRLLVKYLRGRVIVSADGLKYSTYYNVASILTELGYKEVYGFKLYKIVPIEWLERELRVLEEIFLELGVPFVMDIDGWRSLGEEYV